MERRTEGRLPAAPEPGEQRGGRGDRAGTGLPVLKPRTGWRLALVAALLGGASALPAQSVPPKRLAASLERVFGAALIRDSLQLEGKTVYRLLRRDSLLGFARVREVRGKDQPITCLVALDPALRLLDIDILVYREAYGGEVAYDSWRRQFRGHGAGDSLTVGREIRGISGATISVNAVTAGVRATLIEFAGWRQAGRL